MLRQKSAWWASNSARAVCLCRALEAEQPTDSQRLQDRFAKYFLSEIERFTLSSLGDRGPHWFDLASVGLYQEVIRRHAIADSWLEESLSSNIQNLVLLGAGYDSRGWRFARPNLRTIELDRASTQLRKQQCLERFAAYFPEAQVELHPVDFRQPDWSDLLPDKRAPSVVIWEGVTMYLEKGEVAATLQALARKLNPGSQVVVDVLLPGAPMRAPTSLPRVGLGLLGEKLKWTLDLGEAVAFFEPLGFQVTQVVDLGDSSPQASHIGLIRLSRN